jgi:transposase
MIPLTHRLRTFIPLVCLLRPLLGDGLRFLCLCLRPSPTLAAENLFLRKQLALYQERHIKPQRATDATRLSLVWLARWCDWRQALVIVQPQTLIRWHRQGFRLFWRWKSTPGRPPIPPDLQALIRRMACENPTSGEERIANELLLKLGLRVSPRTVRKYIPKRVDRDPGRCVPSQRWRTFVRNHAQAIISCDFCVVVTATFRLLYVFVLMEHATRRILHINVTAHPTAPWTLQQLRDTIPADHVYRFLIHDRDAIFSFHVSVACIQKMLRRRRLTGRLAAAHTGGRPSLLDAAALAFVARLIREQNDLTLAERCERGAAERDVRVSVPTMYRAVRRLRLPYKKS